MITTIRETGKVPKCLFTSEMTEIPMSKEMNMETPQTQTT
jgi:hypothetical protein